MSRPLALLVLLFVSCATSGPAPVDGPATTAAPEQRAAALVRERLASLPRCEPGADVGQLTVAARICTEKFCPKSACCNHCSWKASFETKAGAQPVTNEQVRALLGVPEGGLDCEVEAWNAALQGQSLGLAGAGCVVR